MQHGVNLKTEREIHDNMHIATAHFHETLFKDLNNNLLVRPVRS